VLACGRDDRKEKWGRFGKRPLQKQEGGFAPPLDLGEKPQGEQKALDLRYTVPPSP